MHGQIVQESSQYIVFSGCVDGWTAENETVLGDVEVEVVGIIRREGAEYPAGGENCAAPAHPECYAPELVAAL